MNAGEPPDEAGESDAEARSTDPESGDTTSEESVTESPDGDAVDGKEGDAVDAEDGDDIDPAREVEAAVEEALGPGVLDEGDDVAADDGSPDNGTPVDESADDESIDGESTVDTGDGVPSGDGPDGDAPADDATGDSRDSPSTGGGEPADEKGSVGGAEPADGDDVDETAAVEAAQELLDGVDGEATETGEGAGDTPEMAASETPAETERPEDPSGAGTPASRADGDDIDPSTDAAGGDTQAVDGVEEPAEDVPDDVQKYDRFKKIDGGTYDRANEFLRDRTYITAREWAMARLCADFRTETGVEMTKIGENLPELVPFMTDTYTPQAVNQARAAFEEKVRKAGATFLYGAMCDFFTAEELDDVMYEATEVAKFLLEVEGVELSVEEELAAEDHISEVMRDVREHSAALRHDDVTCPECGHEIGSDD